MFISKHEVDRHVSEIFRNVKSESERNLKCYQIAKLYYRVKDFKSAIKYINRYILTTSNSAAALRLLGECYFGLDLKAKAFNAFKSSLEINGSQHDLVLKICSLLLDPELAEMVPRAGYWLHRAESLFPSNPVIFQLKEHFLKSNFKGKQNNAHLDNLMLSEIKARPTDVNVRIRLFNFFLETKRYKLAYRQALELEDRELFLNDHQWYECLCNIMEAYEKAESDLDFNFYIKKLYFLERQVDLFMQEFQDEGRSLHECSSAVFALDQSLQSISKIKVPNEDSHFFEECMKHLKAQLSFHLGTLSLKRAKKEYGMWSKALRIASPLMLQASQTTMDLEDAWYSMWVGKNKMDKEVKMWSKSAALRVSQAGHLLLAWSQNKGPKFLEKVFQFCGGKWQNTVYQDIFYNKEHLQAVGTSHFVNDSFFSFVPMKILTETELKPYDNVAQSTHPDSLHHLVWLGMAHCNAMGQLSHDFKCRTVPDLQFSVENLLQTGPETLNQLDVDAFLYASVLCGKAASMLYTTSGDRPSKLPINISEELCTPAQAEWWISVYNTYNNKASKNISEMRLRLRKGIETIRAIGQHGLDVKLIVMLAKLFQERAAESKNFNETGSLEDRAYLYWSVAISLLERLEKNQQLRIAFPNRLFDYRGDKLTSNEVKGYLEDGRLFLGCRLMKQGQSEEAVEVFQALKSPYAAFYQGLIYEKLASEEINHRPESITSENRSQHIILLTRARDAFYLTLDRLRCPSVDPNHPLNTQLQDHLENVEKQLAMIDPDNSLNRNGDTESDETDTVPRPLSPDIEENVETSLNIYNSSNFLNVKNHGTPRPHKQNFLEKHNMRFEARPSPERLDAQLRHLVQANNNGLQAIVEQLKEIKSVMQIEFKDLGCVTRDLLAEMKKCCDKLDVNLRRGMEMKKAEDLFNLEDEDIEDFYQYSQPYHPNYMLDQQVTGAQGTTAVSFGTPVPSPNSSTMPENSFPPAFYSGHQNISPLDPSALLYQSLGYYHGLYNDQLNVPDIRGPGVQKELRKKKGVSFPKNVSRGPETVPFPPSIPMSIATTSVSTPKSQPPNVVITSSDTLPAFTTVVTPALSVTIPPQHIRGTAPSMVPKVNNNQIHPFQIQMPPQAQLIKESPTDKLNSIVPRVQPTNVNVPSTPPQSSGMISKTSPHLQNSTTENTLSEGKPEKTQLPEKTTVELSSSSKAVIKKESKLYDSKGQIVSFENGNLLPVGGALVQVIKDEEQKKGKFNVLYDNSKTPLVYLFTPKTIVEKLRSKNEANIWSLSNLQQDLNIPADANITNKVCVKFNGNDENKDFEYALTEAFKFLNIPKENIIDKTTISQSVKDFQSIRKPQENIPVISGVQENKPEEKTNLGGFTFNSSPIIKPPTLKLNEKKEKPSEPAKPSPFSSFSFSIPTSTPTLFSTSSSAPTPNLFSTSTPAPTLSLFSSSTPTPISSLFSTSTSAPTSNLFSTSTSASISNLFPISTSAPTSNLFSTSTSANISASASPVTVSTTTTTTTTSTTITAKANPSILKILTSPESSEGAVPSTYNFFSNVKSDPNSFKGDANFKGFLGKDSLVFGNLNKPATKPSLSPNSSQKEEDGSFEEGDTDEIVPVVDLPDLVDVKTGEENDEVLFEERAKLLRFDTTTKEWKERGVGDFKILLSEETGKTRLIMRRDLVFKVCCNHYLDESMEFKPMSKSPNAVTWCAQDYSEGSLKTEFFALKMKNQDVIKKFLSAVKNAQSKMKNGRIASKASEKPKEDKPKELPPLSELFKPEPGSWECDQCMVKNTKESVKCISCTAPKPGTESESKGSPQPKLLGKGMVFPPTTMTFQFGIPQQASATSTSTANTSLTTTNSTSATAPGLIFGSSKLNNSNSTSLFSAGGGFTFGIPTSVQTTSTPNKTQTETPPTTTAPLFSNVNSFVSSFNTPKSNTTTSIFGGTPIKNTNTQNEFKFELPKPVLGDFKSASTGVTPIATAFNFDSLKLNEKEKFEFKFNNFKFSTEPDLDKSFSPKGEGDGVLSDDSIQRLEGDSEKDLVNNPALVLPEKVPVHTGEEDEEVMYEQRAKLFRFFDKQWKERGIGDVKILKHKTNKKIRLLMRREAVLKVCLNHYVTPDIEFTRKDNKAWQWTAPDFSEGDVQYDMFAIRFKTPEIADGFMKALEDAKNDSTTSPVKTEVKKTTAEPDDDISVVYENQVTPEQREMAMKLQLPLNFYSYLKSPGCSGCPGCDKEEEEEHPSSAIEKPQTNKNQASIPKFNFGEPFMGKTKEDQNDIFKQNLNFIKAESKSQKASKSKKSDGETSEDRDEIKSENEQNDTEDYEDEDGDYEDYNDECEDEEDGDNEDDQIDEEEYNDDDDCEDDDDDEEDDDNDRDEDDDVEPGYDDDDDNDAAELGSGIVN